MFEDYPEVDISQFTEPPSFEDAIDSLEDVFSIE
jgi:hypothetical protein